MPPSAQTSQKTSGGLGDLHVDDWQENGETRIGTLHLVFRHFQGLNQDLAGLRKRS